MMTKKMKKKKDDVTKIRGASRLTFSRFDSPTTEQTLTEHFCKETKIRRERERERERETETEGGESRERGRREATAIS